MSGARLTATPSWLAALQARADQPPVRPRVPLFAGNEVIGSVEPDFLLPFGALRNGDGNGDGDGDPLVSQVSGGWTVRGATPDALTAGLNRLAHEMRRLDRCAAWRNEQLAVPGPDGLSRGTIERAAVRPLGISTHAVHLVGFAPDGRMWVQQRALDKPNDPGLWDTLMGGMVPASDTLHEALARETWEEAGLRIDALQQVTPGGRVSFRRPAHDGNGAGYVVEHIDWFRCTVPDGVVPENQDGEVAQFRLLPVNDVLRAIQADDYTLEAALIIADAVIRSTRSA